MDVQRGAMWLDISSAGTEEGRAGSDAQGDPRNSRAKVQGPASERDGDICGGNSVVFQGKTAPHSPAVRKGHQVSVIECPSPTNCDDKSTKGGPQG